MVTQRTTNTLLFPLPGDNYEIRKLEDHLDDRHELSLSRYYHDRRKSEAAIAT